MAGAAPESGNGQPTAGNASGDVFISYASQDAGIADAIVQTLEKAGLNCWIAPRDVIPGSLYADEIVGAINDAKMVVLILSEHAIASPHVGKEIERASSKRRRIIAVRTDSAPLTKAFEYFLSESQWIDLGAGGTDAAAAKLVEAVRRHTDPMAARRTTAHFDAPSTGHAAPRPGSVWMMAGAVVVLGAALAYLVTDRFWLASRSPAPSAASNGVTARDSEESIAVLPFADLSEGHDQEYFADGMADELLVVLAKIPALTVIGRTSSFQFKDKREDLRVIGDRLHTPHVLQGSIRKSGDRLRVTAQLVNTRTGAHEWSETYDARVGDVLNVQDRIAASVVRALQVTVGADGLPLRGKLNSPEAYDLYLRGRHAFDRFDKVGLESAASYFQQALEIDPRSVGAAEALAAAQEWVAEYGLVPPREGFERARASAQRAIELAPRSAIAHGLLSSIHTIFDWDWEAAAKEASTALALEPHNAYVLATASDVKKARGEMDEAARLLNAAFARDPLVAAWHGVLGMVWYRTGRLADAEAELRTALAISPSYNRGHRRLGQILLAEGRTDAALAEMLQETEDGGRDLGLAVAYHALRRPAESDAALARLVAQRAGDRAFQIAEAHAYRSELDEAFKWLERAYQQKDVELFLLKSDPLLKNLESDARYTAFLRKMNLPE